MQFLGFSNPKTVKKGNCDYSIAESYDYCSVFDVTSVSETIKLTTKQLIELLLSAFLNGVSLLTCFFAIPNKAVTIKLWNYNNSWRDAIHKELGVWFRLDVHT